MQTLNHPPVAKAEMLIRTPVADVFEAFVDPAITSKFWFTKGSGRLEAGKKIRWEWEMYGISDEVEVKEIEKNKRILIAWGSYGALRRQNCASPLEHLAKPLSALPTAGSAVREIPS